MRVCRTHTGRLLMDSTNEYMDDLLSAIKQSLSQQYPARPTSQSVLNDRLRVSLKRKVHIPRLPITVVKENWKSVAINTYITNHEAVVNLELGLAFIRTSKDFDSLYSTLVYIRPSYQNYNVYETPDSGIWAELVVFYYINALMCEIDTFQKENCKTMASHTMHYMCSEKIPAELDLLMMYFLDVYEDSHYKNFISLYRKQTKISQEKTNNHTTLVYRCHVCGRRVFFAETFTTNKNPFYLPSQEFPFRISHTCLDN